MKHFARYSGSSDGRGHHATGGSLSAAEIAELARNAPHLSFSRALRKALIDDWLVKADKQVRGPGLRLSSRAR